MGSVAPPLCGPRYQTIVSPGIPIPGPVGPQGTPGVQGPQGAAGLPGAGLVVKGTVATAANLPTTGNHPGDGWIAQDTGHIWTWSGLAWIDGGPFGGPPGPQGIPGVAGPAGPTGPQGVPGSSNPATTTTLGSIIIGPGLRVQANGLTQIGLGTNSGLVILGDGTLGVAVGPGLIVTGDQLGVLTGAGLAMSGNALIVAPATTAALGGIIVGSGLNVQANGTISVPVATATTAGLIMAGPGLAVQPNGTLSVAAGAGIGISGNNVVLMPATTTVLGGIIVGNGLTITGGGTLSAIQTWTQGSAGAIYYSGGPVGIGVVNPAYTLDVAGQIRSVVPSNTQAIIVGSGTLVGSMGSRFGGMSLGTSSADSLTLYTSGAPRVVIAAGGAVTVSYQLTVNAGAQITGPLQVGPNAILGQAGDVSISRSSAPTTGYIYFGNTSSHYLWFDGAATFTFTDSLHVTGNLTVGGAINSTGSINTNGNLSATGSVTAGTTIYAANAQIASALLTTGNQAGIGTWPVGSNALTVAGSVRLTSGAYVFADGTQQTTAGITTQPAAAAHVMSSAQRTPGNAYLNSNGVTMWVTVTFNTTTDAPVALVNLGSGAPNTQVAIVGSGMAGYLFFPVPNGSSYQITTASAVATWVEWY